MIKLIEIENALIKKLKAIKNITVYGDDIAKLRTAAFLIQINPVNSVVFSEETKDKILNIDITYFPENDKNSREELYHMLSEIENKFGTYLEVKDRCFSLYDIEPLIVDKTLHYTFDIAFNDAVEVIDDNTEYMENIEI